MRGVVLSAVMLLLLSGIAGMRVGGSRGGNNMRGKGGMGQRVEGQGHAYQRCRTRIDELMLRTSRHDHQIASFDVLVFAGDGRFALAGGEG